MGQPDDVMFSLISVAMDVYSCVLRLNYCLCVTFEALIGHNEIIYRKIICLFLTQRKG